MEALFSVPKGFGALSIPVPTMQNTGVDESHIFYVVLENMPLFLYDKCPGEVGPKPSSRPKITVANAYVKAALEVQGLEILLTTSAAVHKA